MDTRYNASSVEEKWYKHWENQEYFYSTPDDREAYSIVIPPPNVTGVLHMGHMLNNTVQDILIRKARLDGKNACWVPGTDHASIATEAKVVHMLREQGIKKSDIGREEFVKHAWDWTHKYGGIILQQLRRLGASCDWRRTAFTMDDDRSESVIQAFVDLYKRGKLYRDHRMVNWDPVGQTVLSNEEVIYEDETTTLCYVRYRIVGEDDCVIIATTRPETIMGDTAIAVNPQDPRYLKLKGKSVIVPLVNRKVPVIFDDYVDMEFGTGALKITPAHDPNDYEIGKRHNLDSIDVLNPDGTMSPAAELFIGEDRIVARKKALKALEDAALIEKLEEYTHSVGRSERTHAVVEPRLSLQWYVDMKALSEPALKTVESNCIQFFPERQKNTYKYWMENIRDWCISRQLWWGHRIPAYYFKDEIFVAASREEAEKMAKEKFGPSFVTDQMTQDEDVLDTWFSSWLWPITCFKGFQDKKELDYYFPTSILVTGWDIIFLWVARMIMAGYEWENDRAFKEVYFTGMVRDKKRRKMSKSLGNSPDALALIDEFGADGVRFGVLSSSPAGGDLLFDEKLCEQGRNFCNKMWNALRLIKGFDTDLGIPCPPENLTAIEWFENKLSSLIRETNMDYQNYRLSDITMKLYSFVWDDFCSWYLELIKPAQSTGIDSHSYNKTIEFFEKICILLHPLMPFITEELWHNLRDREKGEDCMISNYPKAGSEDPKVLDEFGRLKNLISKIREVKNVSGLKQRDAYSLFVESATSNLLEDFNYQEVIKKMCNLKDITITSSLPENGSAFLAENERYFIQFDTEVNLEEERSKIEEELEYAEGFVHSVEKKLSNKRFVENAPEEVVEKERQKLKDGRDRVAILRENLVRLVKN